MAERSELRVVAGIGIILTYDGAYEACMSRNVSRRGMFALSKRQLPEGAEVKINIVHKRFKLQTLGSVASVTEDGVGIVFKDTTEEFDQGLLELLTELLGDDPGSAKELSTPVTWTTQGESGGGGWGWFGKKDKKGQARNLSVDGAFIVAPTAPETGDVLTVALKSPMSGESVTCNATVVRHTPTGFAIQFESPSRQFRMAVGEIRKLAR